MTGHDTRIGTARCQDRPSLILNPWIGDFGRLWSGSVGATAGRRGMVVRDLLACTSFSSLAVPWSGLGWRGGQGHGCGSGGPRLRRRIVAEDVVPQGFPVGPPGPVGRQVQHRFAGGGRVAGRDVDQVTAQGGAAGHGIVAAGEGPGGAQQVVGDHRAGQPGATRGKQPRRYVRERTVDQSTAWSRQGHERYDELSAESLFRFVGCRALTGIGTARRVTG
jgi:hypothetical protein